MAQPELDAIFAANDEMALGALEAVALENAHGQAAPVGTVADRDDRLGRVKLARLLGQLAQRYVHDRPDPQGHPLGRQPDVHHDRGLGGLHLAV